MNRYNLNYEEMDGDVGGSGDVGDGGGESGC